MMQRNQLCDSLGDRIPVEETPHVNTQGESEVGLLTGQPERME
jgi:hypothetical protein